MIHCYRLASSDREMLLLQTTDARERLQLLSQVTHSKRTGNARRFLLAPSARARCHSATCRQTVNWAANATQSKRFYTEPNAGYSSEGEHRFRREAERHSGAKVGSSRSAATAPEERVTRRRSQVGFARCSVCDRQSFARTTPSNRTTNRGSGENRCKREGRSSPGHFSLVRFREEIPRNFGLFRLFQEQRRGVSLQLRLSGGGRWIRTLSPVSSCWVRYYLSATYGDFIPGPSAAEKRIRLGYAIE